VHSQTAFLESAVASDASHFLDSHINKPVQQDELAELKKENPGAYAVVKALLTKQSLGLLDPKHPRVSFALDKAAFLDTSSAMRASQFLENHAEKPIEQDELIELKRQNPSAYAVVKALLTKQSLGLLDPKHPTASFAAEVSRSTPKLAFIDESKSKQPHRDWLNWRRTEDEDMVQAVLSPSAAVKTGLLDVDSPDEEPAPASSKASSTVAVHDKTALHNWLSWKHHDDAEVVENVIQGRPFTDTPPAVEVATTPAPPKPRPPSHETLERVETSKAISYLKHLEAKSNTQAPPPNYLSDFSFDDAKTKVKPTAKPKTQIHSLITWLGGQEQAAPAEAKPKQVAKPTQPPQHKSAAPAKKIVKAFCVSALKKSV